MLYVKDDNGNNILDENGNKITYSVTHVNSNNSYVHREMLHIDDDDHINTENRHIVIKDGINPNHAVSKGQLDTIDKSMDTMKTQLAELITDTKQSLQNQIDAIKRSMEQSDPQNDPEQNDAIKILIHKAINNYNTGLIKKMNKRMKGRVGKKSLTIPKTNHTWIKLLSISDVKGITSLDEVLIQDIYIKRTNRYHNAKSDLVASSFDQLEFFYDAERKNYYCYFNNHPSNWGMDCFFHYVKLPKEIKTEEIEKGPDREL